jgi:hypothetical protein
MGRALAGCRSCSSQAPLFTQLLPPRRAAQQPRRRHPPAMTMRAASRASLKRRSTASPRSTGGPSSGKAPANCRARTTELGSSSCRRAMQSPAASAAPSGSSKEMVPEAGASSGITIFITWGCVCVLQGEGWEVGSRWVGSRAGASGACAQRVHCTALQRLDPLQRPAGAAGQMAGSPRALRPPQLRPSRAAPRGMPRTSTSAYGWFCARCAPGATRWRTSLPGEAASRREGSASLAASTVSEPMLRRMPAASSSTCTTCDSPSTWGRACVQGGGVGGEGR